MLIDTHAHIHDSKFSGEEDQIVRNAFEGGVDRIVTIGTSVRESAQALEIAGRYPGVFASVGVHPEVFNRLDDDVKSLEKIRTMESEISDLLGYEKIVAIGEIGLDYFSHAPNRPVTARGKLLQQTGFSVQMDLARRNDLTPIVHCRDAYADILRYLERESSVVTASRGPVILHCYMGDVDFTGRFLRFPDVFFSFAGNVTYPVKKMLAGTKNDVREVVRTIPLGRILCETDAPYLAPQPVRGKRNEPAFVRFTVEHIAAILKKPFDEVAFEFSNNALRAFRGRLG